MTLAEDKAIAEIEAAEAQAEIDRIDAERREVEDLIAAQVELLNRLKAKRDDRERNARRWNLVATVNTANRRKHEVEQQLAVEEENARVQAATVANFETLEQLSQSAIWRTGNKFGDKALKHQVDGAYVLASSGRAILADSMGVGKTLTSIATLDLIGAKKILIVCPGEIMSGFEEELRKWSERPPIVMGRRPKKEQRVILNMLRATKAEEFVIIINYEAWSRDKALLIELESMCFDTIICDEAHRLKETNTSAYKGVEQIALSQNYCTVCKSYKKICPHTGAGERSAKNVFLLTGTPILNRPTEIYSLLHILRPAEFDNKNAFVRNYCETDPYTGKVGFRPGGMATLASRLSGSYLRRTRETAGIVLPKQDTVVHTIELNAQENAAQLELLEQLELHAQVEIDNGRAVGIIAKLALITRQRQAATWAGGMQIKVPIIDEMGNPVFDDFLEQQFELYRIPEKYHTSAKMDAAYDLLEELVQDGQRVVVFSQFKQALYEMQRRCERSDLPIRSVEYHGDTPAEVRDEVKRNFDRSNHEESKWDAVLCHYKTGGVGLNLTAATQIIILDEEWNPGMNDQAYGRIQRIGQTEETTVHIFRTSNTVDEWMEELNVEKNNLVTGFNKENDGVENKLLSVLQKKVKA